MIVLDASVVTTQLTDRSEAGDRVRDTAAGRGPWHSPDVLDVEVTAALRGRWLGRKLTEPDLLAAVDDLGRMPIQRHRSRSLLQRAVDLRSNLTPYDGVYIALAERLGCPLLTSDARLARAPGLRCEVVVLAA